MIFSTNGLLHLRSARPQSGTIGAVWRPSTPTLEGIHVPPLPDGWWYHGPRLIMQPMLVWWALFCAEVIDWPWRKHRP
jgi:hypothetical protein